MVNRLMSGRYYKFHLGTTELAALYNKAIAVKHTD